MSRSEYEQDVVVSCRIRIARNLQEYPFPNRLDDKTSKQVINKVSEAFFSVNEMMRKEFNLIDMESIDEIEKLVLFEKHLISMDLIKKNKPRGVIISNNEKISIMLNEEDHLRIQCIQPDFKLQSAFETCQKLDILLEEKKSFAFSGKYGYLTSCPTNIGTGIRASVMLHLPALAMAGYINELVQGVSKLGMTVRGTYGEKSSIIGNFFQISNQKAMGQTEEAIIANVNNITYQIIDQERALRQELHSNNKVRFEDRIFRALGVLTSARVISTDESLKLISDVRLGIDMGIIQNVDKAVIDELMLIIQPGSLQKEMENRISPQERDVVRAEIIRKMLV